jgi:hypothetical protein
MEIINKSAYYVTIQAAGTESIDTEISLVPGYPPSKYTVSYFSGSGALQVSQDGNVWINTPTTGSTLVSNTVTMPRYCRISTSGEKFIYLVKTL